MDREEATCVLADAIWWFKGFAAAEPKGELTTPSDAGDLAVRLREIRIWLEKEKPSAE